MKHILWSIGQKLLVESMIRGENCILWDSEGKQYIDLESGIWAASLGHCHPRIINAIRNQAGEMIHSGYHYAHRIIEKAALEILRTLHFSDGKCEFLCSGSEAIEFCLRVFRLLSEKPLLLTMADSYLGAYGMAAARTDDDWYVFDWLDCEDCPDFNNCNKFCPKMNEIPFEKIGGFLFEPGSSSGLVRFPPEKLITNIMGKIRQNNGICIVNEVTTGLGRTGKWYGFEHYSLNPDIVALGKGVGSGYPVSAAVFNEKTADILKNKPFRYGQSHQNDPLGAAVAHEVIQVLRDENLIEKGRKIGEYLMTRLRKIQEKRREISEIRGRGLMMVITFEDNKEFLRTASVHQKLFENGFIVTHRLGSNVLRLDPPLTLSYDEADKFLACLDKITEEVSV